ncbi:MAG: hypothetical protein FWF75_01625 [Propionibacteriaceae bacterium]|nr:hypothetical protein [Propionibacteriaceae bacterium]
MIAEHIDEFAELPAIPPGITTAAPAPAGGSGAPDQSKPSPDRHPSIPWRNRQIPSQKAANAKSPDELLEDQRNQSHVLDIHLKRLIGYFAFVAAAAEVILANLIFFYYAWWRPQMQHLPGVSGQMLTLWYSAVVVQVIGILLVVTRYAFPKTGMGWADAPGKRKRKKKRRA